MTAGGRNLIKMEGRRFGALTVLRRAPRTFHNADWVCLCDCGKECVKRGYKLRQGRVKTCGQDGCSWWKFLPPGNTRRYPLEYTSWEHMWRRCRAKKGKHYKNYAQRGITVCDRWKIFDNFLADMGRRPSAKHSIDRYPDNNGNYEPGNCRWATAQEQRRNMRDSVYVVYKGERILFMELVEQLGLNRSVVYGRLKSGWSLEDAMALPVREHKKRRKQKRKP